jgi:hypothetical protein
VCVNIPTMQPPKACYNITINRLNKQPNQAVQLTPLARPEPGRDLGRQSATACPHADTQQAGEPERMARLLVPRWSAARTLPLPVVPTPVPIHTPASGAADRQRSVAM